MKRISLKLTNNDQSMMIPIRGIGNLLGYDDDVTKAIEGETDSSINDVTDAETRRILPATSPGLTFYFWNSTLNTYQTKVAPDEFTGTTDYNTVAAKNSFYVIQVFDSFRDEVQSKKHTGYFNGFDFAKTNLNSIYTLTEDNEFSNLYIAQSVLDSITGTTGGIFYLKFLFYCAKSGTFYSFSASTGSQLTSQENMYRRIIIDPLTLRWTLNPAGGLVFREIRNPAYSTFVNDTVQSIPVEKPIYPSGNTFDNTGNYITI